MPIELGSPRAKELEDAIQQELLVRGWTSGPDPVMAEFITIMMINSKSAEQITSELEELVGDDYDPEFTTWLFAEAADEDDPVVAIAPSPVAPVASEEQPSASASRNVPTGPRSDSSSILPPTKRSRSPSDNGPAPRKAPRTSDLPDRPRAMQDSGSNPSSSQAQSQASRQNGPQNGNGRSLLDRMGPRPPFQPPHQQQPGMPMNQNNFRHPQQQQMMFDPVQAQIEAVTAANGGMMMPFMNPQMMGMDPNQLQMQELMQSQVMMMAHMQQMMQQIGAQAQNNNNNNGPGFQGPNQANGAGFTPNGRGRGRGGPSMGMGRGGGFPNRQIVNGESPQITEVDGSASRGTPSAEGIVSPRPQHPTSAPTQAYPERPSTPSLCKFSSGCTNPVCRYSHPSPVSTPESGLVLSTEHCENGIKCADKDCTKSHPSPAILNPSATPHVTKPHPAPYTKSTSTRFNPYAKPFTPAGGASTVACRFGANCTKATCTFQHPAGRTTLPGDFHRGLNTTDPTVRVLDPGKEKSKARVLAAGAAAANRFNKTVTFNKPKPAGAPAADASTPAADGDAGTPAVDASAEATNGAADEAKSVAAPPVVDASPAVTPAAA